jgi:hypothetical protein
MMLLAVVAMFAAAPMAGAATVDDFADASSPLSVSGTPGTDTESQAQAVGTILGLERDLSVELLSGTDAVNAAVNGGEVSFTTGDDPGQMVIQWDGVDGSPVLNHGLSADLTAGGFNAFILAVTLNDFAIPVVIEVFSGAGNSSVLSQNSPGGINAGSVNMVYAFNVFNTQSGTGADFTNVTAIQLTATTTGTAEDINFSFLQTSILPTPAALPAGLAMLGLMGLRRRRRA